MKRPAFLDANHPVYALVFSATLLLLVLMLLLGIAHAWRMFHAPPTYRISPVILGNRLMEEDKLQEALREFEEAVKVDPANFEAWSRIGTINGRLGNHERQLSSYRTALQYSPNNAQLHANAGAACFRLKRFSDAADYYRRATRLAPSNAGFHNSLGGSLAMSGDPAAAIPAFERALELDPSLESARGNLQLARRDAASRSSR